MGTSELNLNQFTKGGGVSLLKSYNEDMAKIDAGIIADRARITAAEQAIADLPVGGGDMIDLLNDGWVFVPARQSGASLSSGGFVMYGVPLASGSHTAVFKFYQIGNRTSAVTLDTFSFHSRGISSVQFFSISGMGVTLPVITDNTGKYKEVYELTRTFSVSSDIAQPNFYTRMLNSSGGYIGDVQVCVKFQ